uniref:Uncharacterized protein n=1 Tax=Chromera velia CCMP2878 TaxID=1169474 RepID=A0A0G4HFQ5_9ALVE|eukprot:Cvel_6638.t1-p1 / transcript=Cvel_6638.t1 / gene=Cvel_6638 / organism=Chromera_velia_CCMP2878 / gene_product=Probable chromatin-remodeling complex ATPase chain, putative / transcript_product=Probable chromatin-remodeling complex ATPase chain, putative / location=Cvel_scaffold329:18455-34998(-) / protein_length=1650 / sequence_SO=supercontig / SO=protein_coding / is_pseudo=false
MSFRVMQLRRSGRIKTEDRARQEGGHDVSAVHWCTPKSKSGQEFNQFLVEWANGSLTWEPEFHLFEEGEEGQLKRLCKELEKRAEKETNFEDGCRLCGWTGKEDLQVLCGHEGYECPVNFSAHTFCLSPPLSRVPEDDYYCPHCVKDEDVQERQREVKLEKERARQQMREQREAAGMGGANRNWVASMRRSTQYTKLRRFEYLLENIDLFRPFLKLERKDYLPQVVNKLHAAHKDLAVKLSDTQAAHDTLLHQIEKQGGKGKGKNGGGKENSRRRPAAAAAAAASSTKLATAEGAKNQGSFTYQKMAPRLEGCPEFTAEGGTMREYQVEGVKWMLEQHDKGANSILADEMGLGKTLQVIALLGFLHSHGEKGPHLVVAPLSVMPSWETECHRWCPHLRLVRLHGSEKERERIKEGVLQKGNYDIVVTTYETLTSEANWLARGQHFGYVVMDEAHKIKSERSLVSKAARKLQSGFRLLLTGTPLQNNLHELWALLNFLYPEVLTEDLAEQFDEAFSIKGEQGAQVDVDFVQKAKGLLKPQMLRRVKAKVLQDMLPPKIEKVLYIPLSPVQRFHYKSLLRTSAALCGKGPGQAPPVGVTKYKAMTNLLMQLRKVCDHPFMFPGVEPQPFMTDERLIWTSGKLVALDKLLLKLRAKGEKVLVYSNFTMMLDILSDFMTFRGYKFLRLDGSTGAAARRYQIKLFNREGTEERPNSFFVFLISTGAGGLGINLQSANNVILFDSDWNPNTDKQAMDRSHRFGQKKPVTVYRLISRGTCEERMLYFSQKKLELSEAVLQDGVEDAVEESGREAEEMTGEEVGEIIRFGAGELEKEGEAAEAGGDMKSQSAKNLGRAFFDSVDVDALLSGAVKIEKVAEGWTTEMKNAAEGAAVPVGEGENKENADVKMEDAETEKKADDVKMEDDADKENEAAESGPSPSTSAQTKRTSPRLSLSLGLGEKGSDSRAPPSPSSGTSGGGSSRGGVASVAAAAAAAAVSGGPEREVLGALGQVRKMQLDFRMLEGQKQETIVAMGMTEYQAQQWKNSETRKLLYRQGPPPEGPRDRKTTVEKMFVQGVGWMNVTKASLEEAKRDEEEERRLQEAKRLALLAEQRFRHVRARSSDKHPGHDQLCGICGDRLLCVKAIVSHMHWEGDPISPYDERPALADAIAKAEAAPHCHPAWIMEEQMDEVLEVLKKKKGVPEGLARRLTEGSKFSEPFKGVFSCSACPRAFHTACVRRVAAEMLTVRKADTEARRKGGVRARTKPEADLDKVAGMDLLAPPPRKGLLGGTCDSIERPAEAGWLHFFGHIGGKMQRARGQVRKSNVHQFRCFQHYCNACGRTGSDAGGLLFRCLGEACGWALCYDCMEQKGIFEDIDHDRGVHPRWSSWGFDCGDRDGMGMAQLVLCPRCAPTGPSKSILDTPPEDLPLPPHLVTSPSAANNNSSQDSLIDLSSAPSSARSKRTSVDTLGDDDEEFTGSSSNLNSVRKSKKPKPAATSAPSSSSSSSSTGQASSSSAAAVAAPRGPAPAPYPIYLSGPGGPRQGPLHLQQQGGNPSRPLHGTGIPPSMNERMAMPMQQQKTMHSVQNPMGMPMQQSAPSMQQERQGHASVQAPQRQQRQSLGVGAGRGGERRPSSRSLDRQVRDMSLLAETEMSDE